MPLGPDPERARAVLARLDDLRATVAAAEDDVLACLVVTGEPRPQRVLDDWLDQAADTLRALGDVADRLAPPLARYARQSPSTARTDAREDGQGTRPTGPADGPRHPTPRASRSAPMSVVPGDPASLSACALTARAVADSLGAQATGVRTAYAAIDDGWTGRASAAARRRGAALADAATIAAQELERVGGILQDHATDLADLVARARTVEERAAAAGLEVRDGRVERGWGVTGSADADLDRSRDEVRSELQGELDLVLAQHRRRRDWVLSVLRESTTTLAGVSHRLREG